MGKRHKAERYDGQGNLITPFIVLCDSREQQPYDFGGLLADAKQDNRPLAVRWARTTLASGDYSLAIDDPRQAGQAMSLQHLVAVERKSISDLFGTLGQDRERFERELERLAQMQFAAVVIEASWQDILLDPPQHSALNVKTIHRSVIAWQQRYPRVHWWPCGSRRLSEITTFRILERFYKELNRGNG